MIYEYECQDCKHIWEVEQKLSDPTVKTCVNCNKENVKKIISSGTTFVLKAGGVGWASNKYSK